MRKAYNRAEVIEGFAAASAEAESCFGTPIERLAKMNQPAIDLYMGKGLNIREEMLEIALCAQHNNGGIAVDLWWQTAVPGLFAVGECAGTHGISRPGGSALNAGQVGSLRAAQYLSQDGRLLAEETAFQKIADAAVEKHRVFAEKVVQKPNNAKEKLAESRRRMSVNGAAIREPEKMTEALSATRAELASMDVGVGKKELTYMAYQYRDALLCQILCLTAMLDYGKIVGATRGSALYTNAEGEKREGLEECFRFISTPKAFADQVQQGKLTEDGCCFRWRAVRPLPEGNDFFENIWRTYRENGNIF